MVYKTTYKTGFIDINKDKKLTNRAILKYLEDCSGKHSDTVKNGVADIIDDGITWVLLSWNLKVLKRPSYAAEIEVDTYISSATKLYVYRDFEVFAGGEKVAVARSIWILVDAKTRRPKRLDEKTVESYHPEYERKAFDFDNAKLTANEEADKIIDYPIRKTDIDINDHVHNLNYLDMAYEIMPEKEFDNLIIEYKKEVKYGDKIAVAVKTNESVYDIKVFSKDDGTVNTLIRLW